MANFELVVDSTFKPFTFEEMWRPFEIYTNAYKEVEKGYEELAQKADVFKELSETLPEGSKARQLYEGYANGLKAQADDLSANGLSLENRSALSGYKRRFSGEIGRLERADKAMQEELKRRVTLQSSDPTTLYAQDNLTIDDFIDKNKLPNTYNVSGQKMYEAGIQIGAADSSRIFSDLQVQNVNDYYQNMYYSNGRDPRILSKWAQNLNAIPEFKKYVDMTLNRFGATDNLKGAALDKARESIIMGIINGSTYKVNYNLQEDLGAITPDMQLQAAAAGMQYNNGTWEYDYTKDPAVYKIHANKDIKSSSSTTHRSMPNEAYVLTWDGDLSKDKDNKIEIEGQAHKLDSLFKGDVPFGKPVKYNDLPDAVKDRMGSYIRAYAGNTAVDDISIYYTKRKQLILVPRNVYTGNDVDATSTVDHSIASSNE